MALRISRVSHFVIPYVMYHDEQRGRGGIRAHPQFGWCVLTPIIGTKIDSKMKILGILY